MSSPRFEVYLSRGGFYVHDTVTNLKISAQYETWGSAHLVREWLNERAIGYELDKEATQRILTA